ncbi:peptidylprolyl isomerase [Shewanella septentrionalis]|uniref:peptidylprolyl isomerase n=1 Tax=Shewanella septentrionalis TaxID=2952223 RepID=A0A9X2WSB5_9GAMM|nr:peptidylprolyl isomerase [Shewanella septentrionalis]MCT7944172.1 peptidylprolyl isomerase [Shewanella septentrionalis]
MITRVVLLCITLTLLAGCNQPEPVKSVDAELADNWVARIDGEGISASELELAMQQTLGDSGIFLASAEVKDKVLDSIILRKLMAQAYEKDMSPEALSELELKIQSYREELLTKAYIQQNVVAEPVSDEMVADYYRKHPQKYGQVNYKVFDLVRAPSVGSEVVDHAMSLRLQAFTPHSDWRALAQNDQGKLLIISGNSAEQGLSDEYRQVLSPLTKGKVSDTHLINGSMVRIRVTDEVIIEPKTLDEVRADIRKSLAPIQLKKAIQKEAELLKRNREIERYALD